MKIASLIQATFRLDSAALHGTLIDVCKTNNRLGCSRADRTLLLRRPKDPVAIEP